MNVFEFRDQLISDYSQFIKSFINIQDALIAGRVKAELDQGLLWPEPLLQINPFFEAGHTIDELVQGGVYSNWNASVFPHLRYLILTDLWNTHYRRREIVPFSAVKMPARYGGDQSATLVFLLRISSMRNVFTSIDFVHVIRSFYGAESPDLPLFLGRVTSQIGVKTNSPIPSTLPLVVSETLRPKLGVL